MANEDKFVEPSKLLNAIMSSVYDVLTSGSDDVPKSEDNFISWCTPGIAVDEKDFEFLTQGLSGVVKSEAIDAVTGKSGEVDPALLEQIRAQDTNNVYMQAENFARLVDFVPDVSSNTNDQFAAMNIMSNEGSLSDRYQYILKMSQVMESQLPEKTKAKIEKFRNLLTTTREKVNLITDEKTEVVEPSALVNLYNQKMVAYESAVLEYNSRRIDALSADNAKAVHYWNMNAGILRNRVRAAMSDWVSNGYKNDFEGISAFIDQVMQRDMALMKSQYLDELEKARLTGASSGGDFYYTSCTPANFMNASGWTEFSFKSSDYKRSSSSSYKLNRSKKKGGGGFFGAVSLGGAGKSSSSNGEKASQVRFNTEKFEISFSLMQVQIVRSNWFKSSFLNSKLWRFDANNPQAKGQMVSDGGNPPTGLIPAYPTSMIIIKDLKMRVRESSGFTEAFESWKKTAKSGGGAIQFGPLNLGLSGSGSHRSGSKSREAHYNHETGELSVPGHQIIGFKCHLQPQSPSPLEEITDWI